MLRELLASLLVVLLMACGQSAPPAQSCPQMEQMGCPPASLTYDTGIGELLMTRCSPCHQAGPGSVGAVFLGSYSQTKSAGTGIGTQLLTCSMPPEGAPPLVSNERQQILDWLTCGAPR